MNERYLYRAKRKNWRELPKELWWIEGYYAYFKQNDNHCIYYEVDGFTLVCDIDVSTLCACTGLKDKNGKLIWENDIVSFTHYKIISETLAKDLGFPDFEKEEYKRNYVIEFVNTYCTYGLRFRNKSIHFPCKASTLYMHDCSVVGNIFDNPELLEVSNGRN